MFERAAVRALYRRAWTAIAGRFKSVTPILCLSALRVKPGPKSHAYLLFGFTLARANARMLINAEAKRRSARNSVRASRPQCTSAVAVHG